MEYRGYLLEEKGSCLKVGNIRDFNLTHIFECGQCFRWIRLEDGSYRGVVRGKSVRVSQEGDVLYIENSGIQDFVDIWFDYFDLGTDYSNIKSLLEKDSIMREAIETGYGIRILRQDFWEMLISFIISANNMIPRIMKTVESLSMLKGQCIDMQEGHYGFPPVEALAAATLEELQQCKAGFRCKYILGTSRLMLEGKVTPEALGGLDTDGARKALMTMPGVGPKVADCILLFSGVKFDVFPTDVWVKRVMEELYFKREAGLKEIQQLADSNFGGLKGYAQQYLFYHARLNRIGMA